MKKRGFTLAEILIALGIVGVIAALTMPAFNANTQSAKIGPQLAKAKADFEQAAMAVLNDAQADSLRDAMMCPESKPNCDANERVQIINSVPDFWFNIGRYLKGSRNGIGFLTSNGVSYDCVGPVAAPSDVIYGQCSIDINGTQGPNEDARDIFYFLLIEDGTLVPWGSNLASTKYSEQMKSMATVYARRWDDAAGACNKNTRPSSASANGDGAKLCAGHIFENGLKVEYKY